MKLFQISSYNLSSIQYCGTQALGVAAVQQSSFDHLILLLLLGIGPSLGPGTAFAIPDPAYFEVVTLGHWISIG